ncbi:MAG: hypothetical protein JW928_04895, partial [Candidatus Aureabacteria bacterium]|nr:hypothetical protein [Candidatus Auribacterota bacterium]
MSLKKLFPLTVLLCLAFPFLLFSAETSSEEGSTDVIQVKDSWIYVNGERFFIKGIMYSPAYPGEPAADMSLDEKRMKKDFQMIRESGFNTIKTLYPLPPEAVDMAKDFGLFIIQGIGITYSQDFVTQEYLDKVVENISGELDYTGDKDNILFYCLGMEPDAAVQAAAGRENVKRFFSLVKDTVDKNFPTERITLDYGLEAGFPFIDLWDVACVGLHPCQNVSVEHALGYYGMADRIRKIKVPEQPLILGRLGFSLYPGSKTLCGSRGLTPEEQSRELVYFYSNAIDAGANGLCLADWRDAWWKSNDTEHDHMTQDDNDPCEWLGITYYDKKKKKIITRPAFDALTSFNKMLIIGPRSYLAYSEDVAIEVFKESDIDIIEYRISGSEEWHALEESSSRWMKGVISKKDIENGRQIIEFRAWKRVKKGSSKNLRKTHQLVCSKEKVVFIDKKGSQQAPFELVLDVKSEEPDKTLRIQAICSIKDLKGDPVAGKEITYSISEPLSGLELRGKKISDEKGQAEMIFSGSEPGIYSLAAGTLKAGTDYPRIKTCDLESIIGPEAAWPEPVEVKLSAPVKKKPEEALKRKEESKEQGEQPYKVTIKDDWIYVNGEKLFIKGIGYSPAYPKEIPWKRGFNEARMRRDLQMIKDAGFNTIRTWIPLSPQEIDLAREYGLFVLQGLWVNYTGNFVSEQGLMSVANKFYQEYEKTKDKDNILLYLLGNEPLPSQLFAVGLEKTDKFFMDLKKSIKEQVPDSRVSLANWVQSDFLNTRIWDVICINLYPYYPESVSHSLGYYGYTDWVKRKHAYDKPMILTELGLSVSLGRRGAKGYGGNTEEEQKENLIKCYSDAIDAGASGVCIFEWIDEWWKNFDYGEDQYTHEENDPEEWFGIASFDTEKEELVLRASYHALVEFNKAVITSPKGFSKHSMDIPVEVTVTDDIDVAEVRVGEKEEWTRL